MNDVISRSVDLGYRIVDEYVRQGQMAAQRLNDRSYGPAAVGDDARELATRMAQYASDFTAIWVELMQAVATGASGWPMPQASEFTPSARDSKGSETSPATFASSGGDEANLTRVRVVVTSRHPTEVSLDLRPHLTARRLMVQSLREVDPSKPRMSDVAIEGCRGDEPITLRIGVPTSQPAGVYSGLIIDEETSQPVGTVSLRIAE